MGRNRESATLRDKAWAIRWPDAVRAGQEFFHGDGIQPEALEELRSKGYRPVDFRTLDGEEKLVAMFAAVTNNVYDPSTGELKVLDLHMKHLNTKDEGEDTGKQVEVLAFLDLLEDFASKTRPEWANVGAAPTPAPEKPSADIIDDILGSLK